MHRPKMPTDGSAIKKLVIKVNSDSEPVAKVKTWKPGGNYTPKGYGTNGGK